MVAGSFTRQSQNIPSRHGAKRLAIVPRNARCVSAGAALNKGGCTCLKAS